MKTISLPRKTYHGIRSGIASAFVIDKNEELLCNEPLLIQSNEPTEIGGTLDTLECSVNHIMSEVDVPGLRKNHELIFVSVIRVLSPAVVANDK